MGYDYFFSLYTFLEERICAKCFFRCCWFESLYIDLKLLASSLLIFCVLKEKICICDFEMLYWIKFYLFLSSSCHLFFDVPPSISYIVPPLSPSLPPFLLPPSFPPSFPPSLFLSSLFSLSPSLSPLCSIHSISFHFFPLIYPNLHYMHFTISSLICSPSVCGHEPLLPHDLPQQRDPHVDPWPPAVGQRDPSSPPGGARPGAPERGDLPQRHQRGEEPVIIPWMRMRMMMMLIVMIVTINID